jgi:hypothetical protein
MISNKSMPLPDNKDPSHSNKACDYGRKVSFYKLRNIYGKTEFQTETHFVQITASLEWLFSCPRKQSTKGGGDDEQKKKEKKR